MSKIEQDNGSAPEMVSLPFGDKNAVENEAAAVARLFNKVGHRRVVYIPEHGREIESIDLIKSMLRDGIKVSYFRDSHLLNSLNSDEQELLVVSQQRGHECRRFLRRHFDTVAIGHGVKEQQFVTSSYGVETSRQEDLVDGFEKSIVFTTNGQGRRSLPIGKGKYS